MTNKHIELPAMPLSATFQGNAGTFVYAYTPEQMRDFALAAIAAHEQARVVGEPVAWQTIKSAPKDGTHILAVLPDRDTCYVICWADIDRDIRRHLGSANVGWHMAYDGDFLQPHDAPTHWMPLPAAPGASPPAPQEAQAEPIGYVIHDRVRDMTKDRAFHGSRIVGKYEADEYMPDCVTAVFAAPVAQTATPAPAGQDKEALQVVAYGAFKRPGVYRACHDFQALLHDVPSGAHVEELVRKKDADDAIRAARGDEVKP